MEAVKPKNIETYISSFNRETQQVLENVRQTIKKIVPNADESISYGMAAFKLYGKPLVYFGGYKNHIGFYALPSGNKAFQKELTNYKTGKGSIQFPLDKEMPWKLIEEIVKFREKEIGYKP